MFCKHCMCKLNLLNANRVSRKDDDDTQGSGMKFNHRWDLCNSAALETFIYSVKLTLVYSCKFWCPHGICFDHLYLVEYQIVNMCIVVNARIVYMADGNIVIMIGQSCNMSDGMLFTLHAYWHFSWKFISGWQRCMEKLKDDWIKSKN